MSSSTKSLTWGSVILSWVRHMVVTKLIDAGHVGR